MAYKFREEIVGKRFLSVSGFTKLKLGKITEWGWRSGVIRAASHKDTAHKDLQVLVEYDDVEWHRREWISIYKDSLFHFFLVEQGLVWSDRRDPFHTSHNTVRWPALTFMSLVSSVDLTTQNQPVEFLLDRELAFKDYSRLQPFTEWDLGACNVGALGYPELRGEVRRWAELQDGQRILLTTPSVLVGYRVEVYRAEGTTQWYTAVIVGYNEATRDLTVTDDTVLEEHNEDPSLVQMRLIGDGVVESIMRGENVGITPRRSRSALVHTHHHTLPSSRTSRGVCTPPSGSRATPAASVAVRKPRAQNTRAAGQASPTPSPPPSTPGTPPSSDATAPPPGQDRQDRDRGHNQEKEAAAKGGKSQRKRKCSDSDTTLKPRHNPNTQTSYSNKEDLENKQGRKRNSYTRGGKKKILEEANNSKLRHVEVRVEDCLNGAPSAVVRREERGGEKHGEEEEEDVRQQRVKVVERVDEDEEEKKKSGVAEKEANVGKEAVAVGEDSNSTASDGSSVQLVEDARTQIEEEDDCVIVAEEKGNAAPTVGGPLVLVSSGGASNEGSACGDTASSPFSRMDLVDGSATALLRFSDDRSDSGVSSLRSGSGDERSGSRSSALSVSDDPAPTPTVPVRVWRDPSLLLDEPHVRHIHSVQHQSLLMSNAQGAGSGSGAGGAPPSSAPPPTSTAPTSGGYIPPPQVHHPAALHLHHVPPPPPPHHLPPPGLYPQIQEMLWKPRYPPLGLLGPQPAHPTSEELYERERAYAQDRLTRERRDQDLRDMEKQQQQHKKREEERERERIIERERERQEREKLERDREREKQERERQEREQERERQEKQRAEQAVHKHFEESLRLARQKQFVDSLPRDRNHMPWNLFSIPAQRSNAAAEEDRKRAEQEHQQREQHRQLAATERLRQEARDHRAFYSMTSQPRSGSVSAKTDYPPPAHSRVSQSMKTNEKMSVGHTSLPKAEPNISLFSYPGYQHQPTQYLSHEKVKIEHHKPPSQSNQSLIVNKSSSAMVSDRDRDLVLTNPPPLISEMKSSPSSSVIVKHEVKSPHHMETKSAGHSQSPKLTAHYGIPTTSAGQHKLYEYRSPTQSPHHMQHPHTPSPHHHMEPQNLGKTHHRGQTGAQLPSPHTMQRQSPHLYQSPKPASVSTSAYPYLPPASLPTTATHYALPSSASAGNKPKVSSPAPSHIYGKPSAGSLRVQEVAPSNPIPLTKPHLPSSVSPSPYQQVSQYHPPHQPSHQGHQGPMVPPPPAHSHRSGALDARALYERNIYPGGAVTGKPLMQHHGTSPPTASAAPSPISRSPHLSHSNMPLSMHHSPAVQTQPLDLGVSSNRDENLSPKRKGTPMNHPVAGPIPLEVKKRRLDSPGLPQTSGIPQTSPHHQQCQQQNQPLALHGGNSQPHLARVSEPSPLIANAATTITTVVNTAAYRTPANTIIISQHHPAITEVSDVIVTTIPSSISSTIPTSSSENNTRIVVTSANVTPPISVSSPIQATSSYSPVTSSAPIVVTSPTTIQEPSTPIKVSLTPSVVDSEKSNSPGPTKSTTNYPVRHLKKAWLQRHTGEDIEDTTGVTGTGSCVTLPIPNVNNTTPSQTKETAPPVTYNVGSMAINSINKTKTLTNKTNVRKSNSAKDVSLNGHGNEANKNDDSSSSDQERGRKSPPKRKPPKVKRKKGGQTIKKTNSEDLKKRKPVVTPAVASESGSESEKESGSEKDSDSGASTNQTSSGKKAANGGNNSSGTANSGKDKEPRKRGRRPKSSKNDKGEEPRNKKSRDEPSLPQRDPFRKPPVGQLKKTGESFLQDGPCFEVAPKLAKCRECRWTPNQRSKNMPNIFCRFYAFRRLRYTKNGQLAIAGFSDPYKDASEEDLKLWLPLSDSPPPDLDLEMSRLLLHQVGDHFCDLLVQERDALAEHMSDDKTIAWKRVVQGVREMCDVCETTLFNFHWACGKCGFVVCLDCYKGRKNGTIKIWGEPGKDRDGFSWLQCTNRQPHEQEKLMLTQIIAGDSLLKLGKRVHEFRELWCIPQHCACPLSKESKSINGAAYRDVIKSLIKGELNGIKQEKKDDEDVKPVNGDSVKEGKKSPLSWLADVALSNICKKEECSSDSDGEKEGNFSTLRELLIRPSHKSNGSRAASPANTNPNNNGLSKAKKTRIETLDEVISSVIEDTERKGDDMDMELKHFVRRYNWHTKGREPLPIRIMTLTESKILYPNTPHSWLCDGKLLRLTDPNNTGNYRVFQDQWKRGQPVIVSDVAKNLNTTLWHPDSFIEDFGNEKNDLINCMTGKLVPNQPMSKFWEGFEHFSKRLKDERGNPMLLKLKDWPPGEDFAELMPNRFNDLMRVLPLSEYTHRSGRLNLASRLPDCFVRPDLGPKMYNAYGSALYPTKGTTNLHLDISDAVNVMVYVGIPKDGDNDEHIKEAFRAIDEAGCDILTRRRVRDKGELPGALWHIYNARDADKIRDLLNKVALEKGERLEPHHDPIHDQSGYLDGPLRERLYKEYGVEGYAIVQCLGDAVFIPAGAPHQVRNLHNCIKVAEDFVSPENVSHCFHLTQEFRELSDTHTNHEDKLQIKNIIYHTVKDAISVLSGLLKSHTTKGEDDGLLLDNLASGVRESAASSSDSNSPSGSPASQDTDSKEPA